MAFRKEEVNVNEPMYEVYEDYEISSKGKRSLRLRYMKWGKNLPKYDLRVWKIEDDGTEIAQKGLCLSAEEMELLQVKLNEIN